MKTILAFSHSLLLVLLSGILFTACKKTEQTEFTPERLFMPGRINVSTEAQKASLEWDASLFSAGKKLQYTVELAADSSFQTVILSRVVDTTLLTLTDAVLTPRQNYVARVKANAFNGTPESKWELSPKFAITGEQIFKPIGGSDIIDRAVLVKWQVPNTATKIVVKPAGGTAFEVALSAADQAAGQLIIGNLSANTPYSVEIFDGARSRGFLTFVTKAGLTGPNVIDLRGITGRPSVLADTLPLIPAGSTVVLSRSEVYNITSTISLDKALTIMSGPDLTATNKALIYFTSNFNIASGSNIGTIEFKDVAMKSDNYGSRYVFNINTACNIEKLSFESCQIEVFRGVVRTQSNPAIINEFTVNDCIIDSIANYGVLTVDVASSSANKVTLKNSTVYKAEKVLTSKSNSTSVLISNCTFNEAPAANNYLVDYNATNVTDGIKVENSLLGSGKAGGAVRGIRVGTGTVVSVSNTYSTADYILAATTPLPLPNLTAYSGTSADLWQNPTGGDFRFKDQSFAGKGTAGDPRWR